MRVLGSLWKRNQACQNKVPLLNTYAFLLISLYLDVKTLREGPHALLTPHLTVQLILKLHGQQDVVGRNLI